MNSCGNITTWVVLRGGGAHGVKDRHAFRGAIDLVKYQTMQMDIELRLAAEPKRWMRVTAPVFASVRLSPACWIRNVAMHPGDDLQYRREQARSRAALRLPLPPLVLPTEQMTQARMERRDTGIEPDRCDQPLLSFT
ncbi:MAG: hypothetical protein ACREV2_20400 [Burkholderiales bacterium]